MLPYKPPRKRQCAEPVNLEFMPALVIARLRALVGERGDDVPTLVSASGCGRIKLAFPLAREVVEELYSLRARLAPSTTETLNADTVTALAWVSSILHLQEYWSQRPQFAPGTALVHCHGAGIGPIRTSRRGERAPASTAAQRPTRSSVADSDAATLLDQLLDLKRTLEMERTRTINRVTVKAHVDKMIDTLARSGVA